MKAGLQEKSIKPLIQAMVLANFATEAPKIPGVNQKVLDASILARQYSFADSLKYVWYTTIPFGIIGSELIPSTITQAKSILTAFSIVLMCAALPNIKKYMTNHLAVVSGCKAHVIRQFLTGVAEYSLRVIACYAHCR